MSLGMAPDQVPEVLGYSCIGCFTDDIFGNEGPCNYTTDGLLNISPVCIALGNGNERYSFDFADQPLAVPDQALNAQH